MLQRLSSIGKNITIRNGILFSFFSFLNSGISFLLLIIIAGFMTPEGYGKLNIFNTTVMLLTFFINLNTSGIIPVNYFKETRINFYKTINAVFLITFFCLLLFVFVLIISESFLLRMINLPLSLLFAALFICFFQTYSNVNLDIWRLEEKPISYGIYSLSNVIANFGLTIIFIVGLDYGWKGRIYSQFLIALIFFFLGLFFLFHRGYLVKAMPSYQNIKDILSFGVPLIPHNTSFWLRQGLDRYIINFYHNASLVGLFSFSYNFANIIQIIGTAFNATNSVFIYKSLANKNDIAIKEKLRKQTKMMMIFYICISIIICICTSIFIPFFFPQYKDALIYIIPQCLGAMFQCFYLLFVNFLFYYKKTKILMYITFSSSILHVILSLLLTKYSILYTAYIGMFSNFLIALGIYLYSKKIYKLF